MFAQEQMERSGVEIRMSVGAASEVEVLTNGLIVVMYIYFCCGMEGATWIVPKGNSNQNLSIFFSFNTRQLPTLFYWCQDQEGS